VTSERTEETQGRLRALNLNIVTAAVSAVGSLLLAVDAQSWPEAAVLGAGLAATMVAVGRWSTDRSLAFAVPCLAVAAAVWFLGVLVAQDTSTASYALGVVGTIVVLQLPRYGRAVAAGLVAYAAAVVVVRLVAFPGDLVDDLLQYVVAAVVVGGVGVVLTSLNQAFSGLVAELADAREHEADLAVARERIRFAGDLHDIQGHTLHVVKLKTALARRLVRSDADQAEAELGEIYDLLGDTIAQTRDLAYAQRRLNLSAELENARNLLDAAGIDVRVERRAEVRDGAEGLLGQVLRETTTNILRHAQAGQVRITLSESGITIVNDGAGDGDGPPPRLRGLAALRERVAGDGGELTVERKDGRFTTEAALPQPSPHPRSWRDDR
jgi:two-component system sensor histidine kinase DesK